MEHILKILKIVIEDLSVICPAFTVPFLCHRILIDLGNWNDPLISQEIMITLNIVMLVFLVNDWFSVDV